MIGARICIDILERGKMIRIRGKGGGAIVRNTIRFIDNTFHFEALMNCKTSKEWRDRFNDLYLFSNSHCLNVLELLFQRAGVLVIMIVKTTNTVQHSYGKREVVEW